MWGIAFGDRLAFGRNEGFRMTGAPGTVSFGDELTVRLRNAADESLRTGTSEEHTIQSRRDDGWQNVLVEPDGFDGAAVEHPPGAGFTWRFTIETDGYGGPWAVCGPLASGPYRFVYWGPGDAPPTATPGDPDRSHLAVAFRFTVRDEGPRGGSTGPPPKRVPPPHRPPESTAPPAGATVWSPRPKVDGGWYGRSGCR